MSCDHQLITAHLLDYIEGRLQGSLRQQCELALLQCPQCRDSHEQALAFTRLAQEWQNEAVPAWQRARFAVRPVQQQPTWLSWSALATSCLALLLVVVQPELSVENGLLLSFGDSQLEARLQAALDAQLEQVRSEQTATLTAQLAQFSEAQTTANRLLLAEWLEQTRDERRQDMDFLMTAWESQRYRDLQRTDEQLNFLVNNQIESDQYLNELMKNIDQTERGPL